jgi:fumarate reductase subunit D
MDAFVKRTITPVFWLLFGAGGMVAALFGPALVLITGLAAPTGVGLSPAFMAYARASAFAHNPIGKLVLLAIIVPFVWHGAERIYLTLGDMHAGSKPMLAWSCYGLAAVLTAVTIIALLAIGF